LPDVTELRDLLFDCVKTDPRQRPESARELVSRLKAISESQNAAQRAIELEEVAKKRQAEEERKRREQAERAKRRAEEERSREQPRRYEKPSFFKKLGVSIGLTSRYTDNGDGTVTDNKTGLIWLKKANCSGREMTWKEAMQWAAKLAHGQCGLSDGSKAGDWRLPTKDEWKAMMDTRYSNPALSNAAGTGQWKEGDAFLGVQSFWYWSYSERSTSSAWLVGLHDGDVDSDDGPSALYVWAVRGGH
jgi:hypothetical protein